jgi:hypothetical protein
MPPKTPAIPSDTLDERLAHTPLSGQDLRALLRSEVWNALDSRNAQLVFLDEFARVECGKPLNSGHLADVFDLTRDRVRRVLAKWKNTRGAAHRPMSLTIEQEQIVCAFIRDGSDTGNYVTQRQLLNYIEENFQKTLTYGWVESFLSRHAEEVKSADVSPRELPRLQTPRRYLQGFIDLLRMYVPLVPSELIFNLDETGLSDWEERKRKRVLVRADRADYELHYPVDRAIRHQTLLCCISASGDAYCPLVLSANRGILAIFNRGVRENIDLQIRIVDSPYMTSDIFINYIRTVLIPAVENNRLLPGCSKKPALLFCDNCSCHCKDDVMKELASHGILLITYPPHTSHIFQVLDILLFGQLKRIKKHLVRDLTLGRDLDHIMRIFRAYELATTSVMVRSSWEKAGFGFERRDRTTYLSVLEARIRESPEFAEVWGIDYPEERLTLRRRQQPWGWVNERFFRKEYRRMLPS